MSSSLYTSLHLFLRNRHCLLAVSSKSLQESCRCTLNADIPKLALRLSEATTPPGEVQDCAADWPVGRGIGVWLKVASIL